MSVTWSRLKRSERLQLNIVLFKVYSWDEGPHKRCPSCHRNQHHPVSLSPSLSRWQLSITGEHLIIFLQKIMPSTFQILRWSHSLTFQLLVRKSLNCENMNILILSLNIIARIKLQEKKVTHPIYFRSTQSWQEILVALQRQK